LRSRTKWISCSVSGFEAVIGPTVDPSETPCYLCYTMRSVACAHNPEDEFAYQQFLDRRKRDDSDTRENLVVGHGAVGNLVALEAIKALTGMLAPASLGRIVVLDLLRLTSTPHVVLRKPWCPACFGGAA
jgi:adenylyltransferase/sulfurtransferase